MAIFALFSLPFAASAQELKPFDRLSKNYVPLDAMVGTSGAQLKNQGTMADSSTVKDYASVKEVLIKIPVSRNMEGLTVEAYGVYKDYDSKSVRFEKIDVEKISGQEYRFLLSTDKSLQRVKYQATFVDQFGHTSQGIVDTGRAVNHGERISGWFARAIYQNEIVGVVVSSPQWQQAASQPKPSPDAKGN